MNDMSIKEIATKLSFQLLTRSNKQRPLIVGIDGLGGAGKTTCAKNMEEALHHKCEVTTFHLDDHIVERNKRYHTGFDEWYEYYYLQWDIGKLTANLFAPLSQGCDHVMVSYYDKLTDTASSLRKNVTADSIVIIEGVFLQRPEWRKFFDCRIFVNCPRVLREERVLQRDSYLGDYQARLDKYKERYWRAEAYYMDTVKPYQHTDVLIKVN